jgi:hypothetical protein
VFDKPQQDPLDVLVVDGNQIENDAVEVKLVLVEVNSVTDIALDYPLLAQ